MAAGGAAARSPSTASPYGASCEQTGGLVVAGGHVGELLRVLHLFHVSPHAAPAGGGVVGGRDGADRPGGALPRPGGARRRRRRRSSTRASAWSRGLSCCRTRAGGCDRRPDADVRAGPAVARRHAAWSSTTASGSTSCQTASLPPDARVLGDATGGSPDGGMTAPHASTEAQLAINRLKDRKPLDAEAVDRFLARHEVPVVEGDACTFLCRGEADEVWLVQRIVGLPDRIPLRRLHGTDLWYLVLELPEGSRVDYQIEIAARRALRAVQRPAQREACRTARWARSSVCFGAGYETPDWALPDPDARPGELRELVRAQPGARPRRARDALPAGPVPPARPRTRCWWCTTAADFLQYAATKTVLDNLIHRLDVAETVVAFRTRGTGWSSTPNSAAHSRFLTQELLPQLEAVAPARRAARRPVPAGLELRRGRRAVGGRTGRPTRTAPWC